MAEGIRAAQAFEVPRGPLIGVFSLVGLIQACATADVAHLPAPVSADRGELTLSVRRLLATEGVTSGNPDADDRLVIEAEIRNDDAVDVPFEPRKVSLRIAGKEETDPGRELPLTVWGLGPLPDGLVRQLAPPEILLRNGETTKVWLEFGGLTDGDATPGRLVLSVDLSHRQVELVLADPARPAQRWALAPRRVRGHHGGAGLLGVGIDRVGVTATAQGLGVDLGGVLVEEALELFLLAGRGATGGGLSLALRLALPHPLAEPRWGLSARDRLGPYLGGRVHFSPSFANRANEHRWFAAAELGLLVVSNRSRPPAVPFPLVRSDGPVGDSHVRLGYAHWFGAGFGDWGTPGLVLAGSFSGW